MAAALKLITILPVQSTNGKSLHSHIDVQNLRRETEKFVTTKIKTAAELSKVRDSSQQKKTTTTKPAPHGLTAVVDSLQVSFRVRG